MTREPKRETHWNQATALLLLIGMGSATELVYVVSLLQPFYLPRYYDTPLLDLGKLTAYDKTAGFVFLAVTAVLFALYYAAFRLVRRAGSARHRFVAVILLFAGLFGVTLALVYPYGAADIFDYVFHGRVMAHYGANPFVSMPADFPGDPFLPYVAWSFLPFTYGPVWAAFSAALSALGGNELLANLLLYKGLGIAFYGAALWLIYDILSHRAPDYAPAGLLLFAWNPLVLTEVAANGHNDVVMMAFVLLAIRIALVADDRWRPLTLGSIATSALTKFVTAMLAPLFLVALWRHPGPARTRVGRVTIGVVATVALGAIAYVPFWDGPATLAVLRREDLFTASFPALVKLSLEGPGGLPDAKFVGPLFLLPFGLYCLAEAWRLAPGTDALVAASYRVVLVYLLFACLWFQPWYLIWLLALAAIRPGLDVAHLSMLFSLTAAMNYFVFDYVWIWNATRLDFLAVQAIAVAVIYTLPLAYSLWLLRRARRRAPQDKVWTAD